MDPIGLMRVPAARAPCPWARPSRRTPHQSRRHPAASSGCRSGYRVRSATPMSRIMPISSSSTRLRQAERGNIAAHQAARGPGAARRWSPRSRAAPDRWRPSARRVRRRCRRCACRCPTAGAFGSRPLSSPLRSAATRLRRQIATGLSSTRPRRQAGSHGRSHTRPRMPGKTFDSRFSM